MFHTIDYLDLTLWIAILLPPIYFFTDIIYLTGLVYTTMYNNNNIGVSD